MHHCPDDQGDGPGKTPCHHIGYQFRARGMVYEVDDDGTLTIKRTSPSIGNRSTPSDPWPAPAFKGPF
jgi:hypothetical protein